MRRPNSRFNDLTIQQFTFCFQPQLAAGGVNVAAFFAAQRGDDFLLFQRGEKIFANFFARPFPFQAFDFVVRNQIHFRVKCFGERGQRPGFSMESFTPAIKIYSSVIIRPFSC